MWEDVLYVDVLITVESLIRISSGTIFLWNCVCLGYQTLGRGCSQLPKPNRGLTIGPARAGSPKAVDTLCWGWSAGCHLDLPQDRTELWTLPGREPRAASSPFSWFLLLYKWFSRPFFRNHRICNHTMLVLFEEEFWRIFIFLEWL